jgi:hypothetical protein
MGVAHLRCIVADYGTVSRDSGEETGSGNASVSEQQKINSAVLNPRDRLVANGKLRKKWCKLPLADSVCARGPGVLRLSVPETGMAGRERRGGWGDYVRPAQQLPATLCRICSQDMVRSPNHCLHRFSGRRGLIAIDSSLR